MNIIARNIIIIATMFFLSFSVNAERIDIMGMAKGFVNNMTSSNNNDGVNQGYGISNTVDAYMPDSNSRFAYKTENRVYTGRYEVIKEVSGSICFRDAKRENPLKNIYSQMRRETAERGGNLIVNVSKYIEENANDSSCPNRLTLNGVAVDAEVRTR